mmetsp:Transcript_26638/g.39976  ORF Transcript_26638/g.39976 Transcript_26638/m.39976 type:complete len:326 (-) Transcript_26638:564-1541(-)
MNKATRTRSPGNSKAVIFFGALVLCIIVATISILQEKIYRGVSCDRDGGVDSSSSFSSKATQKARDGNAEQQEYIPASTEEYIMNHFEELGYNNTFENSKGCPIWETPEASTQENYDNLQAFLKDIYEYSNTMQKELDVDEPIPDFLKTMRREGHSINQTELCKAARPHPEGLQALFPSHQLSQTPSGYVEPLLTPMRHPEFCQEGGAYNAFRVDYIIHDFERMCLNLKPHSRAIFVDMGASLEFHVSQGVPPPIMSLLNSFEKNGFHFDHIYALESTKADPNDVYKKLLPEKFFPSYHWINTGASIEIARLEIFGQRFVLYVDN